MQVINTVAGRGQRFQSAGELMPKPLVSVMGKPAIGYLIQTFDPKWKLIFAVGEHYKNTELEKVILEYSPDAAVKYVRYSERGPIDTVQSVIKLIDAADSVAVSYCDYAMLWNTSAFEKFVNENNCDSCIISYRGFQPTYLGPNSYAHLQTDGANKVLEIQEKKIFGTDIQDEWTSAGFYYFKNVELLKTGLKLQLQNDLKYGNEYYTSLAVKSLMDENFKVFNYEVSHFLQLGTPADVKMVEHWYKFIVIEKKKNQFQPESLEDKLFNYWCVFFKKLF